MAKSKHATELQRRGFTRMGRHSLFDDLIRRHGKRGGSPSFTRGTDGLPMTFATDETHYTWMAPGNIDLSDLGFKENTEDAHRLMKQASATRRQKMN